MLSPAQVKALRTAATQGGHILIGNGQPKYGQPTVSRSTALSIRYWLDCTPYSEYAWLTTQGKEWLTKHGFKCEAVL